METNGGGKKGCGQERRPEEKVGEGGCLGGRESRPRGHPEAQQREAEAGVPAGTEKLRGRGARTGAGPTGTQGRVRAADPTAQHDLQPRRRRVPASQEGPPGTWPHGHAEACSVPHGLRSLRVEPHDLEGGQRLRGGWGVRGPGRSAPTRVLATPTHSLGGGSSSCPRPRGAQGS